MMMESMIKNVIDNTLKNDYPHVLLPLAVYARVTRVQDQYSHYEYDLKIIDSSINDNEDFPELPRVKSKVRYEVDTIVVILLMYGQLTPAANGDMLTVTGFDLMLQDISLEAMSQEGELFYDDVWGWSLLDFMQSQLDELTRLEIEQRINNKLGRRQEVDSEIQVYIKQDDKEDNISIQVIFRFVGSDQDYSLGISLDRVKVEVVIV